MYFCCMEVLWIIILGIMELIVYVWHVEDLKKVPTINGALKRKKPIGFTTLPKDGE